MPEIFSLAFLLSLFVLSAYVAYRLFIKKHEASPPDHSDFFDKPDELNVLHAQLGYVLHAQLGYQRINSDIGSRILRMEDTCEHPKPGSHDQAIETSEALISHILPDLEK